MSPVVRELSKQAIDSFILHTGQHYSYYLDSVFFQELELPNPSYNLNVGSGSHAEETGKMLIGIENILLKEKPDIVLAEGDTNSVLAGSLAAAKLGINVGHVEAGLRSYDRNMPEELNRILTDHISDFLFAPTEKAARILLNEGIPEERICITGNTIVDAVQQHMEIARRKANILETLELEKAKYFLVTAHRQENVDIEKRLHGILQGLGLVHQEFGLPLIYPVHPRAKHRLLEFGLKSPTGIKLIEPLSFMDFLNLEANAALVLTDSGGVQEETCILSVPCVTLRDNTERPETLEVGSNVLAGANPELILDAVRRMFPAERKWLNPFGDGKAGMRIVKALLETYRMGA
jgi:UDP-N-acetylglucosamine 2-epimerase (non-hydrolysing)